MSGIPFDLVAEAVKLRAAVLRPGIASGIIRVFPDPDSPKVQFVCVEDCQLGPLGIRNVYLRVPPGFPFEAPREVRVRRYQHLRGVLPDREWYRSTVYDQDPLRGVNENVDVGVLRFRPATWKPAQDGLITYFTLGRLMLRRAAGEDVPE